MEALLAAITLGQSVLKLLEQFEKASGGLTPELLAMRTQVRRDLAAASQALADTLQAQLDADN